MHSFEELDVWKKCKEYKQLCKNLAQDFPKKEEYELKNQLIRAARSITANIAEGFGRYHHQENIQFCRQARGSLTETLDHLIEALDCEYINQNQVQEAKKQYQECLHLLNGYIAYLKRAKASQ